MINAENEGFYLDLQTFPIIGGHLAWNVMSVLAIIVENLHESVVVVGCRLLP